MLINSKESCDSTDDSPGHPDPLGFGVAAFAWAVIVGLIGYLTWAYQAGMLPVWG